MNRIARLLGGVFVLCSWWLPLPASALLVLPQSGTLVFEILEGRGATSLQEFGFGTPSETSTLVERQVLFQVELVDERVGSVSPSEIVDAGYFTAGTDLEFYQRSSYQGNWWAFSSRLLSSPTQADLEVFTDRNGDLGLGGSVIEQLSSTSWKLYLDDAASSDDDDNELIIKVTLIPGPDPANGVPEPTTGSMVAFALAGLLLSRALAAWRP